MSMPGFTAEQSLCPLECRISLFRFRNLDGVSPQFLDFIKEAFESIVDPLTTAAQAAANGIRDAINSLNKAG